MKPFTEREDEQLRKFHELGATIRYQADQLNRPYGSICSRRNTLGLKYFYKGQYNKSKYTEVEYNGTDTTNPAGNPELPCDSGTTNSNPRSWRRLMTDPEALSIALAGIIVFAILFGAPIFGFGG